MTVSLFAAALLHGSAGLYGQDPDGGPGRVSAVFAATNAADRNEVIAFVRNADGTLREETHFTTVDAGAAATMIRSNRRAR